MKSPGSTSHDDENVGVFSLIRHLIVPFILVGSSAWISATIGAKSTEWPYVYQTFIADNNPKPGEDLILDVSVHRSKECANSFYREYYDGYNVRRGQHQWQQGPKPVGKEEYKIAIPIDEHAQPGSARYCVTQAPRCNWVQKAIPFWTPLKCVYFEIKDPNG